MKSYKKTEATADIYLLESRTGAGLKMKKKTFTEHFFKVFKPNPREIIEENKLLSDDTTSAIQDILTRPFIVKEVKAVIKHLNPKKSVRLRSHNQ